MRRSALVLTIATVLVACAEAPSGPTWHADVKPLVDKHCASCHVQGGIAPFALADYATAKDWAPRIKLATQNRTMPPWLAAKGCTDYAGDESLSDADIATVAKWVDAGAPEGDPAAAPNSQGLTTDPGLSRVDVTLKMPTAYEPSRKANDDYRCFLLDWPYAQDEFVTGFRANPGNQKVVHHVIAFLIPPERADAYRQLDASEEGEGWTCFGGPAPGEREINWLGAWAPGSRGNDNPAGTGIRVRPGSKVVLQVHYNLQQAAASETDLSSVDFKVDDQVEHEAFILPWTDPSWVGFTGPSTMRIAAGDADAEHHFQFDPTKYLRRITNGGLKDGESFNLHSASLHMHTLGTKANLTIVRGAEKTPECMLDIEHWDFNWQRAYRFAQPKRFDPGDELYLECHWDNTTAHQRYGTEPKDVVWGEGTGDEMCLGILYISKI